MTQILEFLFLVQLLEEQKEDQNEWQVQDFSLEILVTLHPLELALATFVVA